MRKLQDHSLFPVWSQTMISGITAYILLMFLFSDVIENPGIFIWFGFLIHIFCPMILCIGIYLPLRMYDEKKLLEYNFHNLLKRYLPFIILPFASIFIFLFLIDDSVFYEVILVLLSLYFIAAASLISFIKSIKTSILSLNNMENQLEK